MYYMSFFCVLLASRSSASVCVIFVTYFAAPHAVSLILNNANRMRLERPLCAPFCPVRVYTLQPLAQFFVCLIWALERFSMSFFGISWLQCETVSSRTKRMKWKWWINNNNHNKCNSRQRKTLMDNHNHTMLTDLVRVGRGWERQGGRKAKEGKKKKRKKREGEERGSVRIAGCSKKSTDRIKKSNWPVWKSAVCVENALNQWKNSWRMIKQAGWTWIKTPRASCNHWPVCADCRIVFHLYLAE